MKRNNLLDKLLKNKLDIILTQLETNEYYHDEYISECEIDTDEIASKFRIIKLILKL